MFYVYKEGENCWYLTIGRDEVGETEKQGNAS